MPPSIAALLREGLELSATCGNRRCRHRATVDLEDLAQRHGAAAVPDALRHRMRCTVCGHVGAELTAAPVTASGYARRH